MELTYHAEVPMIHELRIYTLAQGTLREYIEFQEALARPIRGDRYGKLLEYWTAMSGEPSRVVHLWEYTSFEERLRLRAELAANPRWKDEYSPRSHPIIERQENAILLPVPDWNSSYQEGSSYESELRFITLRPGGVPKWIARARAEPAGSPSRPARAWTIEVGQLNTVVGLWHGSRTEGPPLLAEPTLSTFIIRLRATQLSPFRSSAGRTAGAGG
jgi:hypothetical protein